MNETSKAKERRSREGFFDRYMQGNGLDIGYGGDLVVPNARGWDLADGDAQDLPGLENESFDFVYSSHCLEHMRDPVVSLLNWWRVLKPGGYLIFIIPDEDLYEHGIWPSVYNPDHKNTFTVSKDKTWSPVGYNVADLVAKLPNRKVISLRTSDEGFDYTRKDDYDQTLGNAEAAIEAIVQKVVPDYLWRTTLQGQVRCPTCGYGRLGLEGQKDDDNLACLCTRCGWRGALAIPKSNK
jgi:SAM-dependent methyltransferase